MEIRYDSQLFNYILPFVNKTIAIEANVGENSIILSCHYIILKNNMVTYCLKKLFKHSQKESYTHKYPGVDTHTQMYIMCLWIYICKFWFKFILVVTYFLDEKESHIWIFVTERDTCSSCFSLCLDELSKSFKMLLGGILLGFWWLNKQN